MYLKCKGGKKQEGGVSKGSICRLLNWGIVSYVLVNLLMGGFPFQIPQVDQLVRTH
jgi:hypothetical protein